MRLRKVMVAVVAPFVVITGGLVAKTAYDSFMIRQAAITTQILIEDTVLVNNLVNEMQKERGYSAGFIASSGANFPTQLVEQRQITDAAMAALAEGFVHLQEIKPEEYGQLREDLAAFSDIRSRVDALEATVPEMAGKYTGVINDLLALSRPSGAEGKTTEMEQLLFARALLSQAKERAGLERAMGATGLGATFFTRPIHSRWSNLRSAQTALLQEVDSMLAGEGWLANLETSEAFAEIEAAREVIQSGYLMNDFQGLTAPIWFGTSTRWIDTLRAEELALNERITAIAASRQANATNTFLFEFIVGSAVAFATCLFALYIFNRTILRVHHLRDVIEKITNDELDEALEAELKADDTDDELGEMARAIVNFRTETQRLRDEAEALSQEQQRNAKEQANVMSTVSDHLSMVSGGDLTVAINETFPDSYEMLRGDFNDTVTRLREALLRVIGSAEGIESRVGEISTSSDQLSARSESQAATLEETAAALSEITRSVKDSAERTTNIEQIVISAQSEVQIGETVVSEAVAAMDKISTGSQEIANIVGIIEEIAFQTNLLALNAGVEAARAGEAGRGFAVVASEVRALAQRSTDAAMQINSLIAESGDRVKQGVDLVGKAGGALDAIVGRVNEISSLLTGIAEGAQAQSDGLGEINGGMSELDTVTQQNAAMANDVRSVAAALLAETSNLSEVVAAFSTGSELAGPSMRAA